MAEPAPEVAAAFRCTACGKCCLEGAGRLPVVEADVALWEAQAPQVLKYVTWEGDTGARRGSLSRSVVTGHKATRCPFIRKHRGRAQYYCRIYEVRPQVCRRYPTSPEHALYTDCEGFVVPNDRDV